jgi:hypothetical protein
MTFRPTLAAGLFVAFALAAAAQQGAAGKWSASIDTAQGPFAFELEFAVAGNTLTGAMMNEFIGSTPISDGTVNGTDVAFKIKFDAPDGAIVVSYRGSVSGDELKLTSKIESGAPPGGGPVETTFTAKRG